MRPMRPSHHAEQPILQVHLRQVRELDLGIAEPTTTYTVKALLKTDTTALSPLTPRSWPAFNLVSLSSAALFLRPVLLLVPQRTTVGV